MVLNKKNPQLLWLILISWAKIISEPVYTTFVKTVWMLPGVFLFELMHPVSARLILLSNTQYCRASLVTDRSGYPSMRKHGAEELLSRSDFKISEGDPSPHRPPFPATSPSSAVLLQASKNHLAQHGHRCWPKRRKETTQWGSKGQERSQDCFSPKLLTVQFAAVLFSQSMSYTDLYHPRTQLRRQLDSTAVFNTHISFQWRGKS